MSSGGFAVERSVGRLIEKMILVAAGGAAGAVCRYLVSLVPVKADFPVMTFVTNLAGAFLIGLIVGLAANRWSESPRLVLFLKTGFCGGFTTFSTFSLEIVQLLEKGRLFTGVGYAVVSVVACLTGVVLGMAAASLADHV